MHTARRPVALLVSLCALAIAVPAAQADLRTKTVTPEAPSATWTGTPAAGLNLTWFADSLRPTGQCGTDAQNYCDKTLVHFTADNFVDGTQLKFRIEGFSAPNDYDLRVYKSDPTGAQGTYLKSPTGDAATGGPLGANDPRATAAGDPETKMVNPSDELDADTGTVDAWYLVVIPYFTSANATYNGSVAVIAPTP
jgi:hypothetical protein